MKKFLKITVILLGLAFIGIQLKQVDRTNPPVDADLDFDGPEEVRAILQAKCYDCHSNQSDWPWYSYVAPISWWIANHVEEGRREVNYSEWGKYSERRKEEKIEETYDEILDDLMPIKSYRITHPDSKVTEEEFIIIEKWLDGEL